MPSPNTAKTTQKWFKCYNGLLVWSALTTFYHQEAPVLAATQCNAVNCRRGKEGCSPKPGVSQARRGQRRARVKPGGHRGGEGGVRR